MATSKQYIGRREGIGLGIEATPGTAVAPQTWLRWLDQDVQNKTDVIENESAMGVVEKVNDSEVVAKWAEGKIGGKVTEEGVGFLLSACSALSQLALQPAACIRTRSPSTSQASLQH